MKYTLPLSADYVREWSDWHAVREILQNAMDAHTALLRLGGGHCDAGGGGHGKGIMAAGYGPYDGGGHHDGTGHGDSWDPASQLDYHVPEILTEEPHP